MVYTGKIEKEDNKYEQESHNFNETNIIGTPIQNIMKHSNSELATCSSSY
jgi:hypothetical protein